MAATTPAEENKALARRLYEEFLNAQDYDVIEELYASDFVAYAAARRCRSAWLIADGTTT